MGIVTTPQSPNGDELYGQYIASPRRKRVTDVETLGASEPKYDIPEARPLDGLTRQPVNGSALGLETQAQPLGDELARDVIDVDTRGIVDRLTERTAEGSQEPERLAETQQLLVGLEDARGRW